MKDSEWGNPNDFSAVFRCTNRKYAKTFIDYGEIKFNTPQSWVDYALNSTEGRGDKYEGTLAFFHIGDIENLNELNRKYMKYKDIQRVKYGHRTFLKRRRDMELPCFCFYILKTSMFECPSTEGAQIIETTIPDSYFKDFSDQMTKEEVDALPNEEKPAVVFISDYQKFEKKLLDELLSMGLDREEIIIVQIRYIDFNQHGGLGWMDLEVESPYQLTMKEHRFIEQSEARIIINSDKKEILNKLKSPIRLGALDGIANAINVYLHEGMLIKMGATIEKR